MSLSSADRRLPLTGVRVLDMTRVLAGPYCGLLLRELGAEVIKIEPPGRGDSSRRPGRWQGNVEEKDGLRYLCWNLDKKSVTINLYEEEGRDIFKALARVSDVVLENFRPGVMKRMGLDYEVLDSINPGIILASISGFGQDTSFANYPAHDTVIQALSGIMLMNCAEGAKPGRVHGASMDCLAGTFAALGTAAALSGRHATGRGQHVDVGMVDCAVGQMAYEVSQFLKTAELPPWRGTAASSGPAQPAFHDTYRARDGWVYLQADLENQWKRLTEVVGKPELQEDPRFNTERARSDHKKELDAIFGEWIKERTREEVFKTLAGSGVPACPVYSLSDISQHPYLKERGMLQEIERPDRERFPVLMSRIQFQGLPPTRASYAPLLGEHTDEVLGMVLGYEQAKLDDLRERGII